MNLLIGCGRTNGHEHTNNGIENVLDCIENTGNAMHWDVESQYQNDWFAGPDVHKK